MAAVDWRVLADAMSFYRAAGYRAVDLPWFQPTDIVMATCPERNMVMEVDGFGGLIGSAEQAFIGADLAGTLGRGKFVACTPCFRKEPVVDELHRVGFMKVELYRNDDVSLVGVSEMISLARDFMKGMTDRYPDLVPTSDGFDLMIDDVEVGSYGMRSIAGLNWAYGTGAAEPRLSMCRSSD